MPGAAIGEGAGDGRSALGGGAHRARLSEGLRGVLIGLARRGALLKASIDGAELLSPRNGFERAVATVTAPELAAIVGLGWIHETQPGRWQLSDAGLEAARAARASGAEAAPQAGAAIVVPAEPRPLINPRESPLAWLVRRKDREGRTLISAVQYEAGERLRADFWFAQMTPRVTATWAGTASSRRERRATPGTGVEMQDQVIAAIERVRRALKSVGPELCGVLIDVCCHLKGIEDAERAQHLPQRSGKVVLQLALTALARHYGLVREVSTGAVCGLRTRHWGAHDYRPTIERWR